MKIPLPVLALAIPALASCTLKIKGADADAPPAGEEKPKPKRPTLIGRIASIPADRRFVLIQSYGKWTVAAGDILTTRGPDGRTANLLATGEHLGQYAAADLQSGEVEIGDAVFDRPDPSPPPLSPLDPPAENLPPPSENPTI